LPLRARDPQLLRTTPSHNIAGFQPWHSDGLKARHVTAWAGASLASGGPGEPPDTPFKLCKSGTRIPPFLVIALIRPPPPVRGYRDNSPAFLCAYEVREASWTAPVPWRFGGACWRNAGRNIVPGIGVFLRKSGRGRPHSKTLRDPLKGVGRLPARPAATIDWLIFNSMNTGLHSPYSAVPVLGAARGTLHPKL
jgi:hypothetical protein